VAVLSYLVGDNPLYRLAVNVFVGATAAYAALIAYHSVVYPRLVAPLLGLPRTGFSQEVISATIGLVLALLLLLGLSQKTRWLGGVSVAFVVGVGAAVAVGGAVMGTLLPQTEATFLSLIPLNEAGGLDWERALEAVVIIVGTVATLAFFYYGSRQKLGGKVERPAIVKPVAVVGQVFIGTAFGVMYAGMLVAGLAYFAERAQSLWGFVQSFLGG
jgi:hypothetical protein